MVGRSAQRVVDVAAERRGVAAFERLDLGREVIRLYDLQMVLASTIIERTVWILQRAAFGACAGRRRYRERRRRNEGPHDREKFHPIPRAADVAPSTPARSRSQRIVKAASSSRHLAAEKVWSAPATSTRLTDARSSARRSAPGRFAASANSAAV